MYSLACCQAALSLDLKWNSVELRLAGAKIPDLATALQVMYVDYLPLRVGGDLIFKIAKKNMEDVREPKGSHV